MIDRSAIMRAVKSTNTKPELAVRRLVHALGYRFRLHRKELPGKPDLVFVSRCKAIFVHGCFWHGHSCKRGARVPRANRAYWIAKVSGNRERDLRHEKALRERGWSFLVVWECETSDSKRLSKKIVRFLQN